MKKNIWVIVIILVFVLLVVWNNQNKQSDQIKIGGLFGLTGFVSFTAEDSRDGFLMAIEDHGGDANYVIEDFHSDLVDVITAANKLVNIDKVSVVIGPEWNEFNEAIEPMATKNKIPFISPWATSEADWIKSPYYFSATPSERVHNRKFVGYMVKTGVKNIAIIYTNNAWAIELTNIFKDELSKTDIVIKEEIKLGSEQKDMRTELLKIKGLDIDAVFMPIADGGQLGSLLRQIAEIELDVVKYTSESGGQDQTVRSQFSQYAEDLIYYQSKEYKNKDEFEKKFEERYGRKPTTRTASTAYDMTTLVLRAIDEGANNSEDIRKYISNVKNYDGYSNLISFDENGILATEEVVLMQICDGKDWILEE